MNIAFVDLVRQYKLYKKEIDKAIQEILNNASFVQGEKNEEFEKAFAKFCKKKYSIGVNSGTDALLLLLRAHGIGKGDEVITTAFTYIATAMTASCVGAKPVLVDADPKSYTIDVNKIEENITKKTKAIIPVHLYGQPADMDPIVAIAKKHNLIIIEDCAQAHGSKYKNRILPYYSDGAFSFYPGKNLGAYGDGGGIVTDDKNIKTKIELLRNDGSLVKYVHKIIGYKSRLDTLQAAVLLVKLGYLNEFNKKRRVAALKYNKLLSNIEHVLTPVEMDYAYHIYHVYAIQAERRNDLQQFLAKHGIATVIHYPIPIHLQEAYKEFGFKKGDFPVSEKLADSILSLPMFPEITDSEIEYVYDTIRKFYSAR